MDVPRTRTTSRRYRAPLAIAALASIAAVATIAFARMRDAAPTVDASTVLIGTVERGPMVRSILGHGALVPEHVRWVVAVNPARVKHVVVRVGATVAADDVIVELDNPDLELAALDAERQLASAETDLVSLGVSLDGQKLAQKAAVEALRGDVLSAKRHDAAGEALADGGVLSSLDRDDARDHHSALEARLGAEEERLGVLARGKSSLVSSQRAQVERLRAIAAFRREQVAALRVRAGAAGLVQEMPLEGGQWVVPGTMIAKIAEPGGLKAEIRVPEVQARDVASGQVVRVDTHAGIAQGHVARIDPAAQNGTIKVEVALEGELPSAARPELSVDGTIEIERLPDVLHVARPALAEPGRTASLFKLEGPSGEATKVAVELGRASADTIEIKGGLAAGDRVVLSGTTQLEAEKRIRIR